MSRDSSDARWRKSSYSTDQGTCLEMANNHPGKVAVRDSKSPEFPPLVVPSTEWSSFIGAIERGPFRRD
ncbi:DUF397 domain-containing protein [Sphaerisporangium rufum]|uniref:DUF397 domain-containing protein n=1 Tax=Sphaerisporangium rufum TaxID=1381558 RepID=UPI00194FE124|nr:DUF397 domain-containing protein [Sphaerisporangium rufum]